MFLNNEARIRTICRKKLKTFWNGRGQEGIPKLVCFVLKNPVPDMPIRLHTAILSETVNALLRKTRERLCRSLEHLHKTPETVIASKNAKSPAVCPSIPAPANTRLHAYSWNLMKNLQLFSHFYFMQVFAPGKAYCAVLDMFSQIWHVCFMKLTKLPGIFQIFCILTYFLTNKSRNCTLTINLYLSSFRFFCSARGIQILQNQGRNKS